jgi:hypothetical protein
LLRRLGEGWELPTSYNRPFLNIYITLAFEYHSRIPQHHHEDGNFTSAQCHNRKDAYANSNRRHLLQAPLWQRPRFSHPLQQQFKLSMLMVQTSSSRAEIAFLSLVLSKRDHDATLNAHR